MVGTAVEALALAESTVGRRESPPGSNICPPFTDPIPGQPWCAAWCDWVLRQVGWSLKVITPNPYYVPSIVVGAKTRGVWFPARSAVPGDLVCFDWERDGLTDHIGIVVANRPPTSEMLTIEGNTAYGNNSNGGQVMHRTRRYSQIAGVVRPPYAPGTLTPPTQEGQMTRQPPLLVIDPNGAIWNVGDVHRKALSGTPQEVVQMYNEFKALGGPTLDLRPPELRGWWRNIVARTVEVHD